MAKRDVMIFGDPPPPANGQHGGIWVAHLAPLVERPNEWALVRICDTPSGASGTATHLKTPGKTKLPEGRWEFCSRRMEDGKGGIWARYLGVDPIRLVPPASSPPVRARAPRRRTA